MGLLRPDLYHTDVHTVDLAALRARGISALLLDLDNTLLPRDTNVVPPELAEWAAGVRAAGFSACLVSNNWHARVFDVARELGFHIVWKALKPLPRGFRAGMRELGSEPRSTAVIGDQLFTDVLGGNLVGCTTVLVRPLSETDLPHTLLLRRVERVILARRRPVS